MHTTSRPCFCFPLLLPILFFAFMTHCSMATDTLLMGQSLSGGRTLVSNGGRFELGFFSPGMSRNYYIGIWYKEVPDQTVVWVANRPAPLPDDSSELKISEKDGNLLLINHTNIPTWASNSTSKMSNPTVAVLLDSGNLVLRDSSNSSIVIWQSFDHPTDTWLAGAKFGLNKITHLRQRLISWKNSDDPAPGAFSLQIEEDGTSQYFMQWNDSYWYWSTGVWNGTDASEKVLRKKLQIVTHFMDKNNVNVTYTTNENESRFTYSSKVATITYTTNKNENSITYTFKAAIFRLVMSSSGQLQLLIWSKKTEKWILAFSVPEEQCDVFNLCGSFGVCNENSSTICTCLPGSHPLSLKDWDKGDWSSGCVRDVDLSCSANGSVVGKMEEFVIVPNVQLPLNPRSSTVKGSEECKKACSDDCSCTAYAYNISGCYAWSGYLLNLRQGYSRDVTGDLYIRLAVNGNANKGVATEVIVACSISGVVSLSLTVVFVLYWRCHWKLQFHASPVMPASLVTYRYRDLQIITNNFQERLGGGSFGSVFKGALSDSSLVAVKKLEGLRQGEKQFRSEVSTIGMIQHVNLVRLRGFCSEGSKRLLIYDFMPNGSLDSHLFEKNSRILDWKTRYQIALGIAKGLAYLHEKCRECIVHCDIKPENILLDATFCPKIADFGMAKLVGREFSRVLTTMRGTVGYIAPEWIQGLAITAKVDVYSYGMMLFEFVSGSKNTSRSEIAEGGYFPVWAASRIKEDEAACLLDPRLEGNADIEELNRACRVACWCIQENEACRPSMGEVVKILEGVLEVSVPPIPRFLQNLVDNS